MKSYGGTGSAVSSGAEQMLLLPTLPPVFAPRYQSQVLHSAGIYERLAKVSEHLESTSSVHGWRWSKKVGAGQPLWGALQR